MQVAGAGRGNKCAWLYLWCTSAFARGTIYTHQLVGCAPFCDHGVIVFIEPSFRDCHLQNFPPSDARTSPFRSFAWLTPYYFVRVAS